MIESTGRSPFVDLREALKTSDRIPGESTTANTPSVRVDANRMHRTGIPEVVYAGNKSCKEVADALRHLAEANGRALASRVRPDDVEAIRDALEPTFSIEDHDRARALVALRPGTDRPSRGGVVGVMSA